MDPKEEQQIELETLGSIYSESEFTLLNEETPIKFSIVVKSSDEKYTVTLVLTLPSEYPNELPKIEVSGTYGLSGQHLATLKEKLHEEASDSVGMAMAFSLCSAGMQGLMPHTALTNKVTAQEYLDEVKGVECFEGDEEEEQKYKEKEKETEYVMRGTPVTVETFEEWQKAFAEEFKVVLSPEEEKFLAKASGKQLFEADKNLFNAD